MSDLSTQLSQLVSIVTEAGEKAKSLRASLHTELKPDGSIVTNADKQVEAWLREVLLDIAPGASFWGEELGYDPPSEQGQWLIDPIDGTSNYRYGAPYWGVSVALAVHGELVLGAVSLPDLGEVYSAAKGHGAFLNGNPLPDIAPGVILAHELVTVDNVPNGASVPGKKRVTGALVIDGTFTVIQRFRAFFGRGQYLYDMAAVWLMATELHAEVRYADGSPFTVADLQYPRRLEQVWTISPRDTGILLD